MQSIHKNKRKKNIFIYIIIIIVVIIINPFNMFGSVRNIIMIPLTPVIQFGFGPGSYISEHVSMIFQIGTLYRDNQDLQNKVQQLEAENASAQDIKNENKILRNTLNLLPRDELDLIGSDVILRDSLGGNQWILVNRGTKEGVTVGMPVIVNENVLVGVVDEADDKTARVRLITHPDSTVNIVSARTGAEAIAYGKHGLSVVVEDIKKDSDVVDGDVFITSDIGNTFSRGISVGTVQNITISADNLFQKAHMLPIASLDDLRFVFIVK